MKKLLSFCFLSAILAFGLAGFAEKANAQTTPTLIHYWNFNNLAGPYTHPNIPPIVADYTILTPADSAYLEYYLLPGTSASWAITGVDANNASGAQIDNVASTDTTNLRQGAISGLALRARNPTDSSELHWHIPSTGFTNLVVTFATESSSLASGDSAQVYSYSVDGGKTWDSTGMTVNGAPGHILDLTQGESASSVYLGFGPVVITFGSDLTVNNNPNLIFRIVFNGHTHPNTPVSGNNRFDDFTLDGVGNAGPAPASISMIAPAPGSIFVPGQKAAVAFKTFSTVGQVRTIQFSPDSGKTWVPAGSITGDTSTTLTVPNVATTKGLVRVTDSAGVTASIGPFIIYQVPANNLIVDYWAFNTFSGAYYTPNVPNLTADFTAPGTPQGYIQYVNSAKTPKWSYIDNVAGDTVDAHCGAWPGNGLRVRNPTDSMELHFVIPTTGFKGITLSYALQASSTTGPQVEHFSYSTNAGSPLWIAKGLTVNGSKQDSLDVTDTIYQQSGAPGAPYGHVTIGFDTVTSMDNNPNFIFRIVFGDTATGGTSGNNRFDNLTVTATGAVAGVTEPVQAEQQLDLSPNPAMDYVSFENPFSSPTNVSVLDIEGREVQHSTAAAASNVEISTSDLPAGSYYLRIQDKASGAEQQGKFVKQ